MNALGELMLMEHSARSALAPRTRHSASRISGIPKGSSGLKDDDCDHFVKWLAKTTESRVVWIHVADEVFLAQNHS